MTSACDHLRYSVTTAAMFFFGMLRLQAGWRTAGGSLVGLRLVLPRVRVLLLPLGGLLGLAPVGVEAEDALWRIGPHRPRGVIGVRLLGPDLRNGLERRGSVRELAPRDEREVAVAVAAGEWFQSGGWRLSSISHGG